MANSISESSKRIRDMVKVVSSGRMVENMKDLGLMASKVAQAGTATIKAPRGRASGMMASVKNG
jgi:hypothetical protein